MTDRQPPNQGDKNVALTSDPSKKPSAIPMEMMPAAYFLIQAVYFAALLIFPAGGRV